MTTQVTVDLEDLALVLAATPDPTANYGIARRRLMNAQPADDAQAVRDGAAKRLQMSAQRHAEKVARRDDTIDEYRRHLETVKSELITQLQVIRTLRRLIATITAAPVETTGRSSLVWRTNGESVAVTVAEADLINECHEATRQF